MRQSGLKRAHQRTGVTPGRTSSLVLAVAALALLMTPPTHAQLAHLLFGGEGGGGVAGAGVVGGGDPASIPPNLRTFVKHLKAGIHHQPGDSGKMDLHQLAEIRKVLKNLNLMMRHKSRRMAGLQLQHH